MAYKTKNKILKEKSIYSNSYKINPLKAKASLEDDGTLDTVISVSGIAGTKFYRFMPERRRNIKNLKKEAIDQYYEDNENGI